MPNYVKQYTRKSQAERREEIIDAALLILGEHGVDGMTMVRLADAVGITPAALYRHFDSRNAILAAVVDVAVERAMSWVETADAPDALERLGELGRNLEPWQRENLNTMARPIFQTLGSLKEPEFARQMNPLNWPTLERIVATVEEGKRQGTIRSDVESIDVVWALVMFNFTTDMALLSQAGPEVEEALVRNLDRLLGTFRAVTPEPVVGTSE
jgi:AcrR family transcriptional regulator